MALRRPRNRGGAAHREMLALVVEKMNLVGAQIDARLLVAREGVVIVAVPYAAYDVDEFLGALVTFGMRRVRFAVELERVVLVAAGHDIPGGAAPGHMIERGHGARQIVGLQVGRGHGGREAEVFRD